MEWLVNAMRGMASVRAKKYAIKSAVIPAPLQTIYMYIHMYIAAYIHMPQGVCEGCLCVCAHLHANCIYAQKINYWKNCADTRSNPKGEWREVKGGVHPAQPFQPALILLLSCALPLFSVVTSPACSAHLIPIFGAGWSVAVDGEEACRLTLCWAIENRSAKVERMRQSGKQKEMEEEAKGNYTHILNELK